MQERSKSEATLSVFFSTFTVYICSVAKTLDYLKALSFLWDDFSEEQTIFFVTGQLKCHEDSDVYVMSFVAYLRLQYATAT